MTAPRTPDDLTPIGADESITVDDVIMFVHTHSCGAVSGIHDPLCNVVRLLAEDHTTLTGILRNLRQRRIEQPKTTL